MREPGAMRRGAEVILALVAIAAVLGLALFGLEMLARLVTR